MNERDDQNEIWRRCARTTAGASGRCARAFSGANSQAKSLVSADGDGFGLVVVA
jgi:hypothetical protein